MTSFSDLNLDPKVLKAIEATGYTTPTPIQKGAIGPALLGRDVLGIAQTGTGKTAAFTLPMITLLGKGRARARMPRSLVLAPTRELAAQVAENFDTYAKGSRLKKALLIGGVSFKEQDRLIDRGVDVLIATPGRLIDHHERGKLLLTGVEIMVVDEADRMLDMGFIPDIERIFEMTPFTRQTLFFSATMAPEIERITNKFLSNPEKIEVERQNSTSETITQVLVEHTPKTKAMAAKDKRDILRAIIDRDKALADNPLRNAIIFCNRKVDVDIVAKSLKKSGYNAEPIHGDLEQSHRTRTLDGFRDGSITFLVASDVAARGLDIPNVSHVFNYDVPSHAEDYVHRIGRTGRAGKLGTAYTLSVPSDQKYLDAIESLTKSTLPRGENPWSPPGAAGARPARNEVEEEEATAKRSTSRTRSRSRKPVEDKTAEAPVSAPAPEAPKGDAPRAQTPRNAPHKDDRQDRDASDARTGGRSRGGRGRGDDRGPRVVGLGDHVPGFIEMSFEERRGES
ncbi:DEAD/DEAH box helicase [Jannaschia donghaensis]|uniref:DEAD-box ATP-dependent RNA helicase RhpA n=1 Tax=Jannaschia donghaensis TaxID=420998 RepID=A0A0M6YDH8_9RHOB|nr:DEAD/DEAH box helicase [Jannaschia donghaensis]CTQ48402.1 ATP-dependent RNA helicase RhlE [Jannaschia donghaensis]